MSIINTIYKGKTPKGFSYPIGAEALSTALAAVPQFEKMKVSFSWKDAFWASEHKERIATAGKIKVLEVRLFSRSQVNCDWNIHVHAVPSSESKTVRELLLADGLQQLKERLLGERHDVEFFSWEARYDLTSHTLVVE